MEFELTEEQNQIKTSVREFAEAEIAPHVMEWDEAQHFPIELQPKLADGSVPTHMDMPRFVTVETVEEETKRTRDLGNRRHTESLSMP